MIEPTRDDLIYFAGILDAEGCVGAYLNNDKYDPRIEISNTNAALAVYLHETFDFHVYHRVMGGNKKEQWQCMLYGDKTVKLLIAVAPFLKLKQGQAAIVVAMRRIQLSKGHDHPALPALKLKLSELNKRGVA